jgi:alkylhydroperoxidase family enzyme
MTSLHTPLVSPREHALVQLAASAALGNTEALAEARAQAQAQGLSAEQIAVACAAAERIKAPATAAAAANLTDLLRGARGSCCG